MEKQHRAEIGRASARTKEIPILFSVEMVKAILDGRKYQTRRVVKPQPDGSKPVAIWWRGGKAWDGEQFENVTPPFGEVVNRQVQFCRLWVRETWCMAGADGKRVAYRATEGSDADSWSPSIFMPRSASRITLEITGVRVERLQEISEADAKAEGMLFNGTYYQGGPHAVSGSKVFTLATQAYRDLWDSINAKRAPWSSNPWVWVLEFKRLP